MGQAYGVGIEAIATKKNEEDLDAFDLCTSQRSQTVD